MLVKRAADNQEEDERQAFGLTPFVRYALRCSCGASEDRQFYHSPVSSGCGRRDEDTLSCRETVIGSDHLCERVCLLVVCQS